MKKKLFLTIILLSSLSKMNANWFTDYAKSFGNTVSGYASDTYNYFTSGKSNADLLKEAKKDVSIAVDRAKIATQIAQDYANSVIVSPDKALNEAIDAVKYATEQVVVASNLAVEKAHEYAKILADPLTTQSAKEYAKKAFESANDVVAKLEEKAEVALKNEKAIKMSKK